MFDTTISAIEYLKSIITLLVSHWTIRHSELLFMTQEIKLLLGNTSEHWRGFLASLSKDSATHLQHSLHTLQQIQALTQHILQQEDPCAKLLHAVPWVLLPASKVLLEMRQLSSEVQEAITNTLTSICKVCCLLFRTQNCNTSGETLLLITDTRKPLWKEEREEITVTITNPSGKEKSVGLESISEIPDEFSNLCQADIMMAEEIAARDLRVIKREGIHDRYLKIAEVVLGGLAGAEAEFEGLSPEMVVKYIQILNCVSKVMTTQHLSKIFKTLCQSVWQYFTNADEAIIRNITKELFETVLVSLDVLFDRLCHQDKYQWLQSLVVAAVLPLVRCQLLKKKIIGIRILGEICTQVYNGKTRFLHDKDHKAWLIDNKVFEEIYNIDSHDEVIQAGSDILKYLVKINVLSCDQLVTLISLIESGNAQQQKIISKTMSELTLRFSSAQTQVLLEELGKIRASMFNEDMIDIVADTSKYSKPNHKRMGIMLIFRLIKENYPAFKPLIQDKLFRKYIDLLQNFIEKAPFQLDQSFNHLEYFDNILSQPLTTTIVKLLKKVLDLFPESSMESKSSNFKFTVFEVVSFLVEEKEIHERLLKEINNTIDKEEQEIYLELLSFVVKTYKERVLDDKYLSVSLLESVSDHSKVFCQLLYFYQNQNFEELFLMIATQSDLTVDKLCCLKQLMYMINKTPNNILKVLNEVQTKLEVSVHPQNLNGYKDFIAIISETSNLEVKKEAAKFICQLYCYLSPDLSSQKNQIVRNFVGWILDEIKLCFQSKRSDLRMMGYLYLIDGMMNETETNGVGKLISHSSLVNTESVRIFVNNEITFGYDIARSYEAKIPSNKTLFEMLMELSRVFKCSPKDILLKLGEDEIKPTSNGLTLQELDLKDKTLNAYKRNRESVPKATLIIDEKLTEDAIRVFSGIFYYFSPSGKMVPAELARFVEASTNDSCTVTDYRVLQLYNKYDSNKDNIIELECFLSFFQDSCRSRQSTVWKNLEALRIRPDLKRYEDVADDVNYETMARSIIYHSDTFGIFFEMTQNPFLNTEITNLIKRLPTCPKIINETLNSISFDLNDEFMSWYKLTLIEWMIHQTPDKRDVQQDTSWGKTPDQSGDNQEAKTKSEETSKNEFLREAFTIPAGERVEDWLSEETFEAIPLISVPSNNSQQSPPTSNLIHIDRQQVSEWTERFIRNKMYIKILEQAENISQTDLSSMTSISKTCLLLCLQILKNLCKVPELQKPLPSTDTIPEILLIQLPENRLVKRVVPQLFEGEMNTQLLEPLLCLLLNKPDLELDLIYNGLFHKEKEVRIVTTNFLYLHQRTHNYNLNVFEIPPEEECEQFFRLLNRILIQDDGINLVEVFAGIFQEIKDYHVRDKIGVKRPDALLEGKLNILQNILVIEPQVALISDFQEALLDKLSHTLHASTREVLYQLLLKTEQAGIIQYLSDFVDLVQPKKASAVRNHFVGLYNLGCICYMNSILQQFYMIPEFRVPLLGIETRKDISVSSQKGKQFKDSILFQLQRMFCYLELSQRSEYNPEHFCYSFKSDIHFGIQEDSHQFLSNLLEKLECELKGTLLSDLVERVCGGKTIVTITCSRCKKIKYRIEDFNNLQLEVKDRRNIGESLEKFCEEETINDYECQFCDAKVESITKSTSLYKLPNVLTIHLIRMVFNLQTLERVKLHNRLEFPHELDLQPYVKLRDDEVMPEKEECVFSLKGVVIHSGCAESGHYYSLIKSGSGWFKFDDSRVTPFNINDLPEEAYGGQEEYTDWGVSESTRSKNAYMLVYEKNNKTPWTIQNVNQDQKEQIKLLADFREIPNEDLLKKEIQINTFKGYIRQGWEEEISQDHEVLFHELQINNQGFFKFLKSLIEKTIIKKEYFDEITQVGARAYTLHPHLMQSTDRALYTSLTKLIIKVLAFLTKLPTPDTALIKIMIPYIDLLLFMLPEEASQFLTTIDIQAYMETLISHSDSAIRDIHRVILNRCFNILLQINHLKLNDPEDQSPVKTRLLSILEVAESMLYTEVTKNSGKVSQYFQFWKVFSFSSRDCMQYCFDHDFIALMIDFLLEKKSPIMLNPGTYCLSSKYASPPISSLIEMLAGLLQNSNDLSTTTDLQEGSMHILTQNDRKCLTCLHFYKQMFEQKQDYTSLIGMISKLVRNQFEFSQEVAVFLMHGINKSERYESALTFMMLINGFLSVEDDHAITRLQWILGVPQFLEAAPHRYSIKGTIRSQCVQYISSLYAGKSDSFKSVLELLYSQRKNPDSFSVTGVSFLMDLLEKSERILDYVISLPPPNYRIAKYTDWIPSFVDSFQKDRSIVLLEDKDKVAEKCLNSIIKISEDVEKILGHNAHSQVLKAKKPLTIIGNTQKTKSLGSFSIESDRKFIKIDAVVLHTFVTESNPTGEDNLSLPKDLFEKQTNYEFKPLKYFVYKESPLFLSEISSSRVESFLEEEEEDRPQIVPSVIDIRIDTNTSVVLRSKNPEFPYSFYFVEGTHSINLPYFDAEIEDLIEINFQTFNLTEESIEKKDEGVQAWQPNEFSSVSPGFGYSAYYQSEGDKTIPCPDCTFINLPGTTLCEVCSHILSMY